MIRKLLLLIICLSLNLVKGQEENTNYGVLPTDIPTHNLIRYNRFYFNPTFSLVRENRKSINVYNKIQWAGFNDNPQTYLLNYTSNFDEKIGVALGLHQQNEGIYRYFGGIANFAYNLELNDDMNFTFGINLGFSQSGIKSNIDSATSTVLNSGVQVDDPVLLNFENSSSFQLTPGVNFNYTDFDIGVSVVNLVAYNLSASELQTDNIAFNGHVMYTTTIGGRRSDKTIRGMGYANMISDSNSDSQLRYGGSAILDLPKLGWAQAGYNSFYGVSLGVGGNVTSTVSIGYNYEMGLGDTSNFGSTHEITLAYNFATEQKTRRGRRKTSTQQKSYEARDSEIRRLKKEILQQNRLIRELQNKSGDSATQAQRSISRLEKQIQEAKEEEARQARSLALQREEEVKLLNKKAEEEKLAAQKKLEMEMNEQELKMAAQKKLEREVALQKEEEARLASQKKLEMEMNEDTSAEEARIAAEEAAREAEAARQQEEEEKRLAEEQRLAQEAEAARLAEEQRQAAEAEAARLAEEQRLAEEAEAARLAEEQRLAQEAEAARLAEEQRLAQEAEAARLAEEQRLAQEAEAARLAEEQRLAEEAEAARLAENQRKSDELINATRNLITNGTAEQLRSQRELVRSSQFISDTEKQSLLSEIETDIAAKEAEAARLAEEQRLAQEAEAARIAEEQRLAAEAEAARLAEEERQRQEAEAARIAEEQRLAAEAEAARLAEEERQRQEAEAARIAEEQRQAAEAEAARLAAAAADQGGEEGLEEIQKELDNSSRISSKIFARRDSLLTTSLNVDKREFSKLLESLVNMNDDATDAKNDNDPTSSKRLSAKNRFIKFAEASRPEAQYATKFIPGYPEGYYLIGNVFKGGEYANKFANSLKDLGFNNAEIILNPENQFQYVSIEKYDNKEEAAEKYLNNIDNRFYGDMWILHIAKSRVASYKKLLQETRLIKDTVKDDTVVSETLSYIGGHNIQNGYYLITSIFKRENYFERGMERLRSKGLEPQYFRNPKDNYIYVYLKRFDNLDDAKQSLFSNVNNTYDGELYILKIQ
ncbi:PorP/SprF family type IX secretion system membrane protein [Aquimarina sp. MMG016]|uniref:PorP/SprF family type IX secretion system membrane protein n=1 Tax=Aquimarina sp. MMG016 TaxID=2822690 RepID=UPI001B3A5EB7|nr:PorP/SprF family type IX secretion system membrane protein [Aquimarina sp. MMG016]MBQ4820052.1 PorP/SprF family type IX secretion system membrane protein [Aquimarina sp. MMG016]